MEISNYIPDAIPKEKLIDVKFKKKFIENSIVLAISERSTYYKYIYPKNSTYTNISCIGLYKDRTIRCYCPTYEHKHICNCFGCNSNWHKDSNFDYYLPIATPISGSQLNMINLKYLGDKAIYEHINNVTEAYDNQKLIHSQNLYILINLLTE